MEAGDHGSGCPRRRSGGCNPVGAWCGVCPFRSDRPVEWTIGTPPSSGHVAPPPLSDPGSGDPRQDPRLRRRKEEAITEIVESGAEREKLRNKTIRLLIGLAIGGAASAMCQPVWVHLGGPLSWYVGSITLGPVLVALTVLLTKRDPE